jgi:uncharacterized membrane protein
MHSKFGPIVLIVIGLVFLLMNLGVLNQHVFKELISTYWPVILIVVGAIGLITGRK